MSARHVLDVVGGAQRGARAPVSDVGPTTLGSALERDVVLSDPRVPELAMTFTSDADGLRVEVHADGVSRDGEALAPGTHELAGGETLALGDARLVLSADGGTAAPGRDEDVSDPSGFAVPRPFEDGAAAALSAGEDRDASFGPMAAVLLAVTLFATLAIGASYWMHRASADATVAVTAPPEPLRETAARLLADGGFDDVRFVPGPTVGSRLTGYVDSRARLLELQRLARGLEPSPRVNVRVQDEIVRGVEDFYRTQGIAATVESVGAGTVKVVTRVADGGRLAGIEAKVMGDVPGLALLQARNEPPEKKAEETAPRAARRPPIEDADKRVVAVVTGDPSYVVTADDSRYFVGSSLPTGHTIAEIDADSVVLDREGERTRLEF